MTLATATPLGALSGIATPDEAGARSKVVGAVKAPAYGDAAGRLFDAWGQSDSGAGEGGWYYGLQAGTPSDGSTLGWSLLGLIDSEGSS